MDTLLKFQATSDKHAMLRSEDGVVIGLSGGADSVCLTLLLSNLVQSHKLELTAVYVDHGLRPDETPKEAEFCSALCKKLNIPFRVIAVDVKAYAEENKLSTQEAARNLRYDVLEGVALETGSRRVAVAHNLDDQVETFFMRILRGTGPKGLSGMPPIRGKIIRPLIEIKRVEIEAYLKTNNQDFMTDSSNLKDDYMRNKLRSTLIPMLKEFNPNIMDTVARTTEVLADEERYLFITVNKTLMRLITNKSDTLIELFLIPLETLDKAIARRVLRRAIEETKGLRSIGYGHVESILSLLKDGKPGHSIDLPGELRVIKKYSTFLITSEPPIVLASYALNLDDIVELKEIRMKIKSIVTETIPEDKAKYGNKNNKCVFDADKVDFPLTIRSRASGDYFKPMGLNGHSKKLQDFFVDEKIPRYERDEIPVVLSGEDILWVAGYRGDERFSITPETTRYLTLEFIP